MKLLSTTQIQQAKIQDRKLEIDEGIKLAKRIDTLRETLAQEELRLRTFREQTVAQTQAEIDGILADKKRVLQDIATLEQQRAELVKPLKEYEQALQQKESSLNDIEAGLIEKRIELETTEKLIASKNALLVKAYKELEMKEARVSTTLEKLQQLQIEKEKELADIQHYKQQTETELEQRLQAVARKEHRLDADIAHNKAFRETLKKKEYELRMQEQQIRIKAHANH